MSAGTASRPESPPQGAELSFRPLRRDPADLELFNACFGRNSTARSMASLEWQYFENPTGRLFVDVALAGDDRIAAIYASLPAFVRVRGERRLALQSLDTLTDADHRGKGLFVKLANATFASATSSGAVFIYGFPNGNSAHGFFKRLQWERLDPVPFLIRPLRARYVLQRLRVRAAEWLPNLPLQFRDPAIPSRLRLEQVGRFDERFDKLWRAFSAKIGVALDRTSDYLNWRITRKPNEDYTTWALCSGADVTSFVTFCVKDKHGGRVGYVMETMAAPGREAESRLLLTKALAEMRRRGADVALAWCLPHSPNFGAHLRAGFLPFPEKYRPIELHFGARAFDPALYPTVTDRRNWYLSYLDSDTV